MADYSLREIDTELDLPKGSAFRAFKRRAGDWREGIEFRRLDATHDREEIEALRQAHRIYPSSIHVVLLNATAAGQLRQDLMSKL